MIETYPFIDKFLGFRFGLLVLIRVKKTPPGVPDENSPTVRYSKKSSFTLLIHSKVSGSGIVDLLELFEPTAELFLTYPEYLVAGRTACLTSCIRKETTPCNVKKRFEFHSLLPKNLCNVFSLCSSKSRSSTCFEAITALAYNSSNRTPGASYKQRNSVSGRELKNDFIFKYSMKLNFRCIVWTCQNVFVAESGRLLEEFHRRFLKLLRFLPWTDSVRMVNIEMMI